VKHYTETMMWDWDNQQMSVGLDPEQGITIGAGAVEVTAIPPEMARRVAGYLNELAGRVDRVAAGGWVGERSEPCDCGCCSAADCGC
jgi:hypothetical protein